MLDPSEEFRDRALAQPGGDPRFTFLAVAVSPEDGPLEMYDGEDPSVDYHSAANLFGTKPVVVGSMTAKPEIRSAALATYVDYAGAGPTSTPEGGSPDGGQ